MKIKIIAIGKIREKFIKSGVDEFLKRLTPYTNIEVLELLPTEIRDETMISKALDDEAYKIFSHIKPQSFIITMEIAGTELSSEDFAGQLQTVINSGVNEITFIIGSSHGISPIVSAKANMKLSLSKMTFLHQFARLILVEQIYRAFKIMRGETYHK